MSTGTVGRVRTRARAAGRSEPRAKARTLGQGPMTPWLFMAPYLLLFAVFVAIPVIYGLWISSRN